MSIKKVFSGIEIGEMYSHWIDLNPKVIEKLKRRQTRKYKLKTIEGHENYNIYDTAPILIAPFRDYYMILNGKHRGYICYNNNYNLLACITSSPKDLQYKAPKKSLGDRTLEEMLEAFKHMQRSNIICKRENQEKIKNLKIKK